MIEGIRFGNIQNCEFHDIVEEEDVAEVKGAKEVIDKKCCMHFNIVFSTSAQKVYICSAKQKLDQCIFQVRSAKNFVRKKCHRDEPQALDLGNGDIHNIIHPKH